MYYCTECGEEDNFKGSQDFTDYGHEEIFFDAEGDIQDYGEKDVNDGESGDWHDLECGNCGSDITDYDDEQYDRLRAETRRRLEEEEERVPPSTHQPITPPAITNWKERVER